MADEGAIKRLRKELTAANRALAVMKPTAEPPQYSFDVGAWEQCMQHFDEDSRQWMLEGLEHGFDVYVDEKADLKRENVANLPMTELSEKVATAKWIKSNLGKSAIWGPFESRDHIPKWVGEPLRISPIGTVKKGLHFRTPEHLKEWRVIHHLSHPRKGMSVNSEVLEQWGTVQYVRFKEVVQMVKALGVGAKLWTVDAKDAYLRVPINRRSMKYMGFKWAERTYLFTCLSFGLASAPRIYTLFADAVLSIIKEHSGTSEWWQFGEQLLVYHYIDDFFGGAPVHSLRFKSMDQFRAVVRWFDELGIPTKDSKCSAPATVQKILGFEYDTERQLVLIPKLKAEAIKAQIDQVLEHKQVPKDIVLSLIGMLRWMAVCNLAGPAFVRRMEEEANMVRRIGHKVAVKKIRADLKWWSIELNKARKGVRFDDILRNRARGDMNVYTDASTGDGMGGWNRAGQWFRFGWSQHERVDLFPHPQQPDIYWKEMVAVAVACLIWGAQWRGMAVTFWIDNQACVWSLIKMRCDFKRGDVMHLIRVIAACSSEFGFSPYFVHIAGKENLTADALSRFDVRMFHEDTAGVQMSAEETVCRAALDGLLNLCFGDEQENELDLVQSNEQRERPAPRL